MKRALRFAVLAAALTTTSWLAAGNPVQAVPSCAVIQGQACSDPSGTRHCNLTGTCQCLGGQWYCGCSWDDDLGRLECPF
jgi:hypothetical protein